MSEIVSTKVNVLIGVAVAILVALSGCSGSSGVYRIEARNSMDKNIDDCSIMFDDDLAKVFKFGLLTAKSHKGATVPFQRMPSTKSLTVRWRDDQDQRLEKRLDIPAEIKAGLNASADNFVVNIKEDGGVTITSESR